MSPTTFEDGVTQKEEFFYGSTYLSQSSRVLWMPAGVDTAGAAECIRLLGLVNDVSLRNLIPAELGKQFGFYQSKPWTAFTPVLVTPDELGDAWDGRRGEEGESIRYLLVQVSRALPVKGQWEWGGPSSTMR